MQLIKPRQISGEIMTLIEEADSKVILVTPYFKVKNWYKFINTVNNLKSKHIEVEIFIREGEYESEREVRALGFEPISIPNLHTKLYLSEKSGIVSSMNLLHSSDTNSLDIALKTESAKEYSDLWEYYLRYIQKGATDTNIQTLHWQQTLEKRLLHTFDRVRINEQPNCLKINTSNRYEITIKSGLPYCLRAVGILSVREYEYAIKNPDSISSKTIRIVYLEGGNGHYSTVVGFLDGLKSQQINILFPSEVTAIVNAIIEFITGVEEFKKVAR